MDWLITHVSLLYSILLTLSLFNIVVLLWLTMTVLLYAARRTRAVWLAGLGLAAGALFFVSHTTFVVQAATGAPSALATWWPVGWISLIYAPYAWYLAMLWHVGFWGEEAVDLRQRHRLLLALVTALGLGLLVIFITARPVPTTIVLAGRYFMTAPLLAGIPLLIIVYPVFTFLCIGFSFEALVRPGPVSLAVQGPARVRARPWLVAATISLLTVSVLMLLILIYLVLYAGRESLSMLMDQPVIEAYWLDVITSLTITAAVVSTGQAIVAYEIFTGGTLPRRGLRRQWHEALFLAGGFSTAVGVSFSAELHPIYTALIATVLVAVVFSLLGWRAHLERHRFMGQLRPFAASEGVFEGALSADARRPEEAALPLLEALCRDTLEARSVHLVPTGYVSGLVPGPFSYPLVDSPQLALGDLLEQCSSPDVMTVPVDPRKYAGAIWAIPLWSARGLMGVLFLGGKVNGGIYSEEEIEIARAVGERLLDLVAATVLTRRLISLQRQRLAELHVLDQQSRRVLHDEVLPTIHTAMLELTRGGETRALTAAVEHLVGAHRRVSSLVREMPSGAATALNQAGLIAALREAISLEFGAEFDSVEWALSPQAESKEKSLPTAVASVAYHAAREVVRNSARHGRGGNAGRPLHLRIEASWRDGLELAISDDGVGVTPEDFRTGSGSGLEFHSTMLAVVGGSLVTEARPGGGTRNVLRAPQAIGGE